MLEIIVLPLLTMVTCKETRAVIIAYKKGFTGKDTAASKNAPNSTIYWIIKNLEDGLVSRRATKNPFSPGKTSGTDCYSAKGTGIGLLRTGVKSFSLMNPLSDCLGDPE